MVPCDDRKPDEEQDQNVVLDEEMDDDFVEGDFDIDGVEKYMLFPKEVADRHKEIECIVKAPIQVLNTCCKSSLFKMEKSMTDCHFIVC
ncbi:hypothetical protein ScPMuIL_007518 [Solemya velum]